MIRIRRAPELGEWLDVPGDSLVGIDLSGQELHRARLEFADLRRARFRNANARGAFLTGSDLSEADFTGANLVGADARLARCVGARFDAGWLSGAQFNGADLREASCAGARLDRVHLENARLEGADLRGVGVERAFLAGASYDRTTLWPEGFDPGALGAVAREDGRIVVVSSAQEGKSSPATPFAGERKPDIALAVLRHRPELFLGTGEVSGPVLVRQLLADLQVASDAPVLVGDLEGWWVVASTFDWVEAFRQELSVEAYFTRVVTFLDAGVNRIHTEVLLSLFAGRVVTGTPAGVQVIRGPLLETPLAEAVSAVLPGWQRFVAFQF